MLWFSGLMLNSLLAIRCRERIDNVSSFLVLYYTDWLFPVIQANQFTSQRSEIYRWCPLLRKVFVLPHNLCMLAKLNSHYPSGGKLVPFLTFFVGWQHPNELMEPHLGRMVGKITMSLSTNSVSWFCISVPVPNDHFTLSQRNSLKILDHGISWRHSLWMALSTRCLMLRTPLSEEICWPWNILETSYFLWTIN